MSCSVSTTSTMLLLSNTASTTCKIARAVLSEATLMLRIGAVHRLYKQMHLLDLSTQQQAVQLDADHGFGLR